MNNINVAVIGGGNGLGQVLEALLRATIPGLRAMAIVSSFDDDGDDPENPSSTGCLRRQGRPGYYSDLTWVLGKMHFALFGDDWLFKMFGTRFRRSIRNEPFGDLLAEFFGSEFKIAMGDPEYRESCIDSIRNIMQLETSDYDLQMLLEGLFDHLLREDSFEGHSFRNLLLVKLEDTAKELGLKPARVLDGIHLICRIPPEYRAVPAMWEFARMNARTKFDSIIESQRMADFRRRDQGFDPKDGIEEVWVEPEVRASEESISAVLHADIILLSCGSISNIRAPFSMGTLKAALRERMQRDPAPSIVYVMNFMTEAGITRFARPCTAAEIVGMVEEVIGQRLDGVIYDGGRSVPRSIRRKQPEPWIRLGKIGQQGGGPWVEYCDLTLITEDAQSQSTILHHPGKLGNVFRKLIPRCVPNAAGVLL